MNTEQIEMQGIEQIEPERKKIKAGRVFGIIGEVCKWIIFALLLLIVIMNVSNLYKMKVKNEQVPTFLGIASVRVIGNSMYPTLKIDDMIIICHKSSYKVGDIVTFIDNVGITVTHRIKEIRDDGTYVTAGDYTGSEDPQFLSNDDIIGKVIITLPAFGKVLEFFQSIWGLLLLVVIGFIIIELPYAIKAIKEHSEKKKIKERLASYENSAGEQVTNDDDAKKE